MTAKCGLVSLALLLAGCSRAPSFDLLGSFFPAWLLCLALGIAAAAPARWLISRLGIPIAFPVLAYPTLALLFTFTLWLTFFRL
jgi:hypothetical protein